MPPPPRYSRLLVTGMLALVAAFVGWLLFLVGGDRSAMISLPDGDGATVEMWADPSGVSTPDEVAAKPAEAWTSWNGEGYMHAENGVALWVRVTLRNLTDEVQRGVLGDTEYFSDRVELWERDANAAGGWRSAVSGESVPHAEKPLWSRMSPFPVDLPARSERTFYFRLEDRFAVWSRIAWWPRTTAYFSEQIRDAIAEAACYGALFGLLVYNTVFWVRLRDAGTGCYVLYASALTAANFLGNGGPALLGWPMGSPWKEAFFVVALGGSTVFLVMFARGFLESGKRMPRADQLARGLRVVLLGFVVGAALLPWMESAEYFHYLVPVVALSHGLMLSMGVIAWRQGVYHARYFVAASGAMLAGALPAVVQWTERDLSQSAAVGVLAGSVLEITLLAFAVAGRFARLQQEKADAQARLVEEMEQRRAMQEAYADELEVEVRERTHELELANADKDRMLALLGHDLRSPLTAMTQTAEQIRGASRSPFAATLSARAGIGGSTAGNGNADVLEPLRRFAGDVADAGRQMLLLIEDIVLWSRLRVGAAPASSRPEVRSIVGSVVLLHRALAERRKVDVIVDVRVGLVVQTDLVLVQALARNLVGNAVKFAQRRVEISASVVGDGVRLAVRDDGPGLPETVAARLRGGPAGDERGFGLRLCQEICDTLGLRIEAATPPQGGTEMSVTLPLATVPGVKLTLS